MQGMAYFLPGSLDSIGQPLYTANVKSDRCAFIFNLSNTFTPNIT